MKTILVTGATGAQGGSVARHLLQQGNFKVKCLTRNPESDAALALQSKGAEVVKGDLSDKASLTAAMQGCYGVFGVTNFWEHFDGELQHGRNLVDAVEAANIEHFVFSTLPSAKKLSNGTLSAAHFETKAAMEDYSRSKDIPATYVHAAFYFENFLSYFPPTQMEDDTYGFGFPQGNTPLAALSIEDLGGIVNTIFNNPSAYIGKLIGAVELATQFTCNRLHIPERKKDQKSSHEMYPEIKGFEQWLMENKDRFAPFFQEQTSKG